MKAIEVKNGIIPYFKIFQKLKIYNIFQDSQTKDHQLLNDLLRKPVFLKGNADWVSELSSVIKHYDNTIHSSTKMTPIEASKKANEKLVYSNLQDQRVEQQPKYKLGQLVRTADIKKVFSIGDSNNYSYKLYVVTEVIQDTIPSLRLTFLPEK